MARSPRLNIPNGVYHVTNRGVERRRIVDDNSDRRTWTRLLNRVAFRCGWRIFAYALLRNHFHIFLRTPDPNLSEGMHDFESGFASLYNRRHDRVGPLFQGRFKSILVEFDSYSWELSRYVHLNPNRAGVAAHPADYIWSSYRFYLDPAGAPGWLDWQSVVAELGQNIESARLAYRRLVESGMSNPPANPFRKVQDDWLLGSPSFVEHWRSVVDSLHEGSSGIRKVRNATLENIVRAVSRCFELEASEFTLRRRPGNRPREAALLLAREFTTASLSEISEQFGHVSRSAISTSVSKARDREKREPTFHSQLDKMRRELNGEA